MNEAHGLHRLGIVQGDCDGTLVNAHLTAGMVAVLKDVVGAGVTQHIDARIAGELLGAVAPEDDFSLQIEDAHADLEGIEYSPIRVWILESWHGARNMDVQEMLAAFPSAADGLDIRSGR